MREVFQTVWEVYGQFNGTGMHMGMFFASLLFLNSLPKTNTEKSNTNLLTGYSVMFFFIFFFPVTAKIIINYCIGPEVYWRMLWILPVPVVVAYAFAIQLKQAFSPGKRAALMAGMAFAIALTGTCIYTPENFSKAENIYKIPQNVVEICDMIREDAQEHGMDEKRLIVTNELLPYIRQYDASIKMPYGRDALKNQRIQNKNCRKIFKAMCSQEINFEYLVKYARRENYDYLVYYNDALANEKLYGLGYEMIGECEAYRVYRWAGQAVRRDSFQAYPKEFLRISKNIK